MIDATTQMPETFNILDYNLYLDDINIVKGRLPENDYEVIVNNSYRYSMKLNSLIDVKVNNTKLKVVGFYDSKTDKHEYFVNNNTVKYGLIERSNKIMIYPKQKDRALNELKFIEKLNVQDKYAVQRESYINERKDSMISSVIFAGIILGISLIEIYLMERASFLSRIKEVRNIEGNRC